MKKLLPFNTSRISLQATLGKWSVSVVGTSQFNG